MNRIKRFLIIIQLLSKRYYTNADLVKYFEAENETLTARDIRNDIFLLIDLGYVLDVKKRAHDKNHKTVGQRYKIIKSPEFIEVKNVR